MRTAALRASDGTYSRTESDRADQHATRAHHSGVDDGSTQTDAPALERQRDITIKSAVARYGPVLQAIADKLSPAIVPMGSVGGLGTRRAAFIPLVAGEPEGVSTLVEGLAEHDDGLLVAYVEDDATINHPRLRVELAAQTKRAIVHPVFFGSAITGAGVDALTAGIAELLPARSRERSRRATGWRSGGEGVLESAFDRYQPVRGAIPTRPRSP